jgi:hypothetical protein
MRGVKHHSHLHSTCRWLFFCSGYTRDPWHLHSVVRSALAVHRVYPAKQFEGLLLREPPARGAEVYWKPTGAHVALGTCVALVNACTVADPWKGNSPFAQLNAPPMPTSNNDQTTIHRPSHLSWKSSLLTPCQRSRGQVFGTRRYRPSPWRNRYGRGTGNPLAHWPFESEPWTPYHAGRVFADRTGRNAWTWRPKKSHYRRQQHGAGSHDLGLLVGFQQASIP